MTNASRNLIGAFLALGIVCLMGWLSTNMWSHARQANAPHGTVVITPVE